MAETATRSQLDDARDALVHQLKELASIAGCIDSVRFAMPVSDMGTDLASIVEGGIPDVAANLRSAITAAGGDPDEANWWAHYCRGFQVVTVMREHDVVKDGEVNESYREAMRQDPVEWMAERSLDG